MNVRSDALKTSKSRLLFKRGKDDDRMSDLCPWNEAFSYLLAIKMTNNMNILIFYKTQTLCDIKCKIKYNDVEKILLLFVLLCGRI